MNTKSTLANWLLPAKRLSLSLSIAGCMIVSHHGAAFAVEVVEIESNEITEVLDEEEQALKEERALQDELASLAGDPMAQLQLEAIARKSASWGHWGKRPDSYSAWTNHSNRLIPVYVYGGNFRDYTGSNSLYRNPEQIAGLYGRMPESTFNEQADYADQTDVYRLQRKAIESGEKKYVILVVFDGMDWQTTWAAATYRSGEVHYESGRGTGLVMQDYRGAETDFGYIVTAPHSDGLKSNVDTQTILDEPIKGYGGYNTVLGGEYPWSKPSDPDYLIGRSRVLPHAYTDSSSSATSLTAGVKTFNNSVNVMPDLRQVETIAHWAQSEKQMAVGVVTSVPIPHATPAAAYSHNVSRNDYQDLTRDLIGLPSIAHPNEPLPGMDVVIGTGWGETSNRGSGQGSNFVPGNIYVTDDDLETISNREENRYTIAVRTPGRNGKELLQEATERAIQERTRLLGFFGGPKGHLPFRTADGDYRPVRDVRDAEVYTQADIEENPTLADMTHSALKYLSQNENGFWLMVEAGDVDWANHANNIDNSIGAVISGDEAIATIFDWVEEQLGWDQTLVVITSDHGHYLNITDPSVFTTRP